MISVIIPVYNDPIGVERTIQSLVYQQAVVEEYEILIVDNGSTDETGDVIQSFESSHPDLVTSIEETDIQSSYAARNAGIEEAKGEILAFLDADMWVEEAFIRNVSMLMSETESEYVGLNVSLASEGEIKTLAGKYNQLTGFPVERYLNKQNFAPTCCLLVRSNVIEMVGGFDDQLKSGGDYIFGRQVAEAGFDQTFCDSITVYHPVRDSTSEMLQKAIRIGQGKTQIGARYPNLVWSEGIRNPRSYLPPNPINMWNQVRSRNRTGLVGFLMVYAFGILFKYTRLFGSTSEIIKIWGKKGHFCRDGEDESGP